MEALMHNNLLAPNASPLHSKETNNIPFYPYQDLMVEVICDFRNDVLTFASMIDIARNEIELLLVAKAKNPGKINIERLASRNIRLAILNKLRKVMS